MPRSVLRTHWIKLPIRVEEANDALRLLERLNQSIQKNAIKATVVPTNAVLVVFIEGVHEGPLPSRSQQGNAVMECALPPPRRKGYQGRSPWLVSSSRLKWTHDCDPDGTGHIYKITVHERGRALRLKDELIKLDMEVDFTQVAP